MPPSMDPSDARSHTGRSPIDCMESRSLHDKFLLSWDCKGVLPFLAYEYARKLGTCVRGGEWISIRIDRRIRMILCSTYTPVSAISPERMII